MFEDLVNYEADTGMGGGEGGGATPPPASGSDSTAPATADVKAAAPATPVEDTTDDVALPDVPGRKSAGGTEVDLLRQQYANLYSQFQKQAQQLQQYEYASLDEDEAIRRQYAEAQQRAQMTEQQLQELRNQQAMAQWRDYFGKWVPEERREELIAGDDATLWQHNVLKELYTQNRRLQKKLKAYEALEQGASPAPKVTAQGGGQSTRKTVRQMSLKELMALKRKAGQGLLKPEDYPPIT